MSRNASARSLLQGKISNSKGAFNPHTGKLKEDEEEYIPKKQTVKKAEKSASSLRSQGQTAEVVRDTELKKSLATLREKAKAPTVKINTDKGFTVKNATVNPSVGWKAANMTKSTAKDEKTRLYETNDSLLNPKEIIKKYSYVAQDKDMDYSTLRKAVNKGMSEVGRTLRGTNDNSQYEKVAKLQAELQGRLKSASFTAGMLDSMGGNGKDILAKISRNEALQKQNEAFQAQMAQTKANNSGYATIGALAGEMAKAGAGYMTIGKAAEEAALKGAGKLGQRMAASTAPDAIQKMAAKMLFDPKNAKKAQFATRMLGQQAADTAVNTPITIAAGLAEGKSRGEIGKDIAKQEAMDAAFNLGIEGLGAATKAIGNAAGTKIAMHRIPKQIEKSMTGKMAVSDYIKMGKTPEILEKYGMIEGNMVMPQTVVPKVAYPAEYRQALAKGTELSENSIKKIQGHNLGFEAIRQLPDKMKRPVAILKSDTQDGSLVVLTDMIDVYGNPVIVPVKVDANGYSNFSTVIPSMYGRRDFETFMKTQKEKGNVLYLNQKKNLQHFPGLGVQFPDPYSAADPMIRIAQRSGNVKAEELENITKGHKLAQAEQEFAEGKTKEVAKSFDANSPQVTSKNVSQQPSDNSIAQNSGNVKERAWAEKIDREEAVLLAAKGKPTKKLSNEEIRALEKKYAQMSDFAYLREKGMKMSDIQINGNSKKVMPNKEWLYRKKELEETLLQQYAMRTDDDLLADAGTEFTRIFQLEGKGERQISNDLKEVLEKKKAGTLTQGDRDDLFASIFSKAKKNQPKPEDIRKLLKERKLAIGRDVAAEMSEGTMIRLRGSLGKINIGQDDNIGSIYAKLSEAYPAYFPRGYRNKIDQLLQMQKVSDLLAQGKGLKKEDYKEAFDLMLDEFLDGTEKRKAFLEKAKQRRKNIPFDLTEKVNYGKVSPQEVQAWSAEKYRLEKQLEQMQETLSPLKAENEALLEKMVSGTISAAQAKKIAGPEYGVLEQLYNIKKPLHMIDERIAGRKKYLGKMRREEVEKLIGSVELGEKGWKDKIGLAYELETQERNLYDIAPDKETAERVIGGLIDPVHEKERQRILFSNERREKLGKLGISTKKNLDIALPGTGEAKSSESALVQYLGENRFKLQEMGEAAKDSPTYKELERHLQSIEKKLRPEQLERINKGIAILQEQYKELWELQNDELIRNGFDPIGYIEGYFPHMNFDDPKGPFQKMATALGFDFSENELPMDIAGRTENFRPRKKWAGHLLSRTGEQTDYDAIRAFDVYLDNASNILYHTENISRLRAAEEYFRYAGGDEGLREEMKRIRMNKNLTPEEQQTKLDNLYRQMKSSQRLQGWVQNLSRYADQLAGKKHKSDRIMEDWLGRRAYSAANRISGNVAGNMVAANIGSALTNFIPITQGMKITSMDSNLRGAKEAFQSLLSDEMDDLTKRSAFLATRPGMETLYKTTWQRLSTAGGAANPMNWMEGVDKFTTQLVWRARFYDNMKQGFDIDSGILEADKFCRSLFAGRSKGAMPTIFHAKNPVVKALTMFQLEANNNLRYLAKDLPREAEGDLRKLMGRYMGIALAAYMYNDLYEKATGRRSALDPFGIANEFMGEAMGKKMRNFVDIAGDAIKGKELRLTEETEPVKTSKAMENALKEIGGNVPFVGGILFDGGRIPIKSAIPHPVKAAGNISDWRAGEVGKEKTLQDLSKNLFTPASYLLPVIGTGQIRKSYGGLKAMQEGGSYTWTNEGQQLQFPIDQDKKRNWIGAAGFGKWATQGGQAHLEKDRSLGAKQTETYEKLVASGAKNMLAFETINKVRKEEKAKEQRRVIRSSLLSGEQKAILYYDFTDSETDKEILDYFKGKDSMAEAADCLSRIADYEGILPKRNVLQNANLSDAEKEYICLNKIVQEDDIEKEKARIAALRQAGVGMNDYLKIKNKYAQIDESKSKTMPEDMSQWLREEGYTWQQQAVIKDQFAFWGMYKQKYK